MDNKIYDSDLKLMNVLWTEGPLSAQQLAIKLMEQVGWGKTTTYTMIKKCLGKGLVERIEPGFICRPLVSREQVRQTEAADLMDKLFDGAPDLLMASLLSRKKLNAGQIEKLRNLVNELK